jgi:hypothetical protein
MAYGLPVIATGYSGNLQFMDRRNSFLVDCRETAVAVADGPYQRGSMWAEPDVEHAAALMRLVYDRPDLARAVGARARADVRRTLSPDAVARIALAALGWQAAATAAERTAVTAAAPVAVPAAGPAAAVVAAGAAAAAVPLPAVAAAGARRRGSALKVSFGTQ